MIDEYISHGWKLTPIIAGTKLPACGALNGEWGCIDSESDLEPGMGVAINHFRSGTCALDIENMELAISKLKDKFGFCLRTLLADPSTVAVSHLDNKETKIKLLFKNNSAMRTSSPYLIDGVEIFEFRGGGYALDLIPPSIHPCGIRYEWSGDWRKLPPIPEALLDVWIELVDGLRIKIQ